MKTAAAVHRVLRERYKGTPHEQAAVRAGMHGALPSHLKQPRAYRTRSDPFADDWPWATRPTWNATAPCKPTRGLRCCATNTLDAIRRGQLRTFELCSSRNPQRGLPLFLLHASAPLLSHTSAATQARLSRQP